MVDLKSNESGQLMLLTGLLIILQVIVYTTLLNNLIFTNNMPASGLDISKHDIREIRSLTEADIKKAAYYSSTRVSDPTNQTMVETNFTNYVYNYSNTINRMYSNRGASVEILLNNVTFNKTTSKLTANKYYIEKKQENFPNGSLIIPMDGNQTSIIKVYGLLYKIVDDTNTSGLSSIRIPVYQVLQNPVNNTVPDFYSTILTDDNASISFDNITQYRKYSGGPFIIHNSSINETTRQMILTEAANKSITIHELKETFTYNNTVKMVVPPRVSFFASSNVELMEQYYIDSDVPATQLTKVEIIAGNLTNFDILTIPHEEMNSTQFSSMISPIVGWVANGGVIHIECAGTDTMDDAIEASTAGSAKPWYGFIGVTRSDELPNGTSIPEPGIKLLDNSTLSYNNSPPMPLSGLSDPGAPYNPLTQSSIANGTFGTTGGTTKAFSLRNPGEVNPGTNILGYAVKSDGSVLIGDYDNDGTSEPQLMYLEAPYDNGLVIYIAGHNLTARNPSAEGFIFESFFAASMRNQEVTVVSAKNINVTIKYSDGKVKYSDTFLVNI
ncbi:MAG: hypothetical protein C3F06_04730 [Candidatus Methanoperedenaceae archaeon]|nr:MAG: hypothetical protein C3F06_04730 [Candidatus Methanoperedenaceae archaeon]